MSSWTTPKTDWKSTDAFNISDYNRIKNNLSYLHEESEKIYGDYTIDDMGSDMTSYSAYWNVAYFNAFENNLNTINGKMLNLDLGIKKTFYENGVFITYDELNRIESASLKLKAVIEGWYEGVNYLPYRLGAQKGVKE